MEHVIAEMLSLYNAERDGTAEKRLFGEVIDLLLEKKQRDARERMKDEEATREEKEMPKTSKPMSLDEIKTAHNIDVWLEEASETQVHPLLLVESELAERHEVTFFWPAVVRPLKAYNKTWRCWKSRPAEKQRITAKWEEEKNG